MTNNDITESSAAFYMRKIQRWRMAFFGLVILVAGIAIGGASVFILAPERLMQPPPGPEFDSMRMIPPLRQDLDLTPEQEKKIKPILDKHMQKLQDIRTAARSSIEEALARMNKSISEILTEEQRQRWQHSFDRLDRELHPGGPRRGGGPGGHGDFRSPEPDRFRGGPGPFGPHRSPRGPNSPRDGTDRRAPDS